MVHYVPYGKTQRKLSAMIKPEKCEKCGDITDKLEKHHPDYRFPLKIKWLCRPCHSKMPKGGDYVVKKSGLYYKAYLGVRFSKEEMLAIKNKAEILGIAMSTYVRMIVKQKLESLKSEKAKQI